MLMTWRGESERALVMELGSGGVDWLGGRAHGKGPLPHSGWGVQASLGGSHYKLGDVFPSQSAARGCGWWLTLYGPGGSVRECGIVAR